MVKKIAVISLSSGIMGESFIKHELDIGLKRLEEYGVQVVFTDNALAGMDDLKENPQKRAQDFLNVFRDDSVDMILCAIGGDDTYRLLPYLFEHDELKNAVKNKIFLGFSDTTINHFMLHKVGLRTFYGQAFLPDVCELEKNMLPYSKYYFEELLTTGRIKRITPSDVWYEERECFDDSAVGTPRISHTNYGFELLQGSAQFKGQILGGCIDSMYDIFNNERYEDSVSLCEKYSLFPSLDDWNGKILLIESSEEKPNPELYHNMIKTLKNTGIFEVLNGVLVGKPMDETSYEAYKEILIEEINRPQLPILYNVNIGHATPRCIIPFGVEALVDAEKQTIEFSTHYML